MSDSKYVTMASYDRVGGGPLEYQQMRTTLSVLDAKGDTKITWDHRDASARADARRQVAALKAAGYVFYMTGGLEPADEINSGRGELLVRRLTAEEVVRAEPPDALERDLSVPPPPGVESMPPAAGDASGGTPGPAPGLGGRPKKSKPAGGRNVIAVRPVAGG